MLRPAPVALALVLLVGCGGTPTPPPPTRVAGARQPVGAPAKLGDDAPLRHPDRDPPPPRSAPQIAAADIDAALAASAAARAAGDDVEAMRVLLPCANKVPKHIRCEGELAIILARLPNRKAEARYYLEQAIADDDPGADADFYRRLAAALQHGANMWPEAAVALERTIARLPEPAAADYEQLAFILQGVENRTAEAAAALQRAFELAPGNLEYLREAGMLLSQLPDRRAEALSLLQRYREAVRGEPDKLALVERTLGILQGGLDAPASDGSRGGAAKRAP